MISSSTMEHLMSLTPIEKNNFLKIHLLTI